MDRAMIEINKLEEEIELLKKEKDVNTNEQNELEADLKLHNNFISEKQYYMKKLKGLKLMKAALYAIFVIFFSSFPVATIGLLFNTTLSLTLLLSSVTLFVLDQLPNFLSSVNDGMSSKDFLNLAIDKVQYSIDYISNKFEKAKEVEKNKESFEKQIMDLKIKNNEIDACINEKNNRIDKFELIRKEVIAKFTPELERTINTSYESFIEEENNNKVKIKIK